VYFSVCTGIEPVKERVIIVQTYGEWYTRKRPEYKGWENQDTNEIVFKNALYYGLPAVVMVALIVLA
jgi:hypothetical protein